MDFGHPSYLRPRKKIQRVYIFWMSVWRGCLQVGHSLITQFKGLPQPLRAPTHHYLHLCALFW